MVELYANSALHYENDYGKTSRNSWLTGKGFFKVVKDSTRPFTVYSSDISTTAPRHFLYHHRLSGQRAGKYATCIQEK